MTDIQIIFAAALVVAVLIMRRFESPEWKLPAAFAVLLAISAINTGNMIALGIADLCLAVAALTFGTKRGYLTAGLFAAMGGAYAFGSLINIPDYAIYGLVELLCIACLGVMINADRWGGRFIKRIKRKTSTPSHVFGRGLLNRSGGVSPQAVQEKAR